MGPAKWTGGRMELMLTSIPRPAPPLPFVPRGRPWTAFGATHVTCPQCSLPDVQQRRPGRGEWGLIGQDGGAFRRVLKPDLEVPCGPQLPGGTIAAPAFVTKQT